MDELVGNFLFYERKNPNFYYTPERRWASYTSEPGGESWDPVLNTRRSFQETGIARKCTFPIISSFIVRLSNIKKYAVSLSQSNIVFLSIGSQPWLCNHFFLIRYQMKTSKIKFNSPLFLKLNYSLDEIQANLKMIWIFGEF